MITSTKEGLSRIFRRAMLEFLPPICVGLLWLYFSWRSDQHAADHVAHFTSAFFAGGWLWGNLLRIHHQQTQKHEQADIAGGVKDVRNDVKVLSTQVAAAMDTMAAIEARVSSVLPTLAPQDAKELSDLIDTANTQLATANSSTSSIESKFAGYPHTPPTFTYRSE